MKIKQIFNDEDKKALEYMLKFKYCLPYEAFGSQERSRKLLHVLTPILYMLSGLVYYIGNYIAFSFVLLVAMLSTMWIIWFHFTGKKYERKVDDVIYKLSKISEVTIDEERIVYNDEVKYSDITKVVFYKSFIFIFVKIKGYFILKLNNEEGSYLKTILDQHSEIRQEIKSEPFNILDYIEKSVIINCNNILD
ncbi:hypothetical protein [Clostridium sp.]|uniref:hypothetical protein n=1 Tax=Clostridium sp. TaxID=1506 RepID=UPI00290B2153|nr:hypothetical protein [Clostridium sp.]MDU6521609.1 hypothetical protein [Clostridium sp.]